MNRKMKIGHFVEPLLSIQGKLAINLEGESATLSKLSGIRSLGR